MKKVDLIIPGLLNLPAHEVNTEGLKEATPCLHRLLRFASPIPNTAYDIDDILIQRLGLKQGALPYAYAQNPAEQMTAQIVFKPVYLKSDINNAIVFPVDDCDGDIDRIINDLNNYFKEDCSMKKQPDNSWLMILNRCQPPTGLPHYLTATGKKVTHYLEQAKANLDWFKLFNEIQMYLFQHEVNSERTTRGLPTINSLWCWGADDYAGEFLNNTAWYSDDIQMQDIGRLYCAESLPVTALEKRGDKDTIIVDLSFLKALKGDSNLDVFELLLKLEKDYLQPLIQSDPGPLCLHTGGEFNFDYKPWMKWKLWRKGTYPLIR